jgi:hypothetical protein
MVYGGCLLWLATTVLVLPVESVSVRGTPAPCNGTGACPYYWHAPAERFYEVFVNDVSSFVYQSEIPSACKDRTGPNCAFGWNVKSQSFTLASVDFSAGPVSCKILTRFVGGVGRLATKPFSRPTVASRFGAGAPTQILQAPGEYVFNVTGPGHYSVELFGQADLTDALLLFLDEQVVEPACPIPAKASATQHRFTGPGVANPGNPSWSGTGYYKLGSVTLNAGDVVCVERGALVVGHLLQSNSGCHDDGVVVQGTGVWSGDPYKTPADDRTPLMRLCGQKPTVRDITLINALGSNVELK